MAKVAGRQSRLYIGISDGAEATPLIGTKSFSVDAQRDAYETTSQGDTSKTFLVGLPGGSGQFAGFFDTAGGTAFSASIGNALSRKVYGYFNSADATRYFYCTALFSASMSAAVDGVVEVSGNFNADTPLVFVGV
jgi:dihydrodipicolinate synthase/N-acetylneuraminate lyase